MRSKSNVLLYNITAVVIGLVVVAAIGCLNTFRKKA